MAVLPEIEELSDLFAEDAKEVISAICLDEG
jgi:hypothetical protein